MKLQTLFIQRQLSMMRCREHDASAIVKTTVHNSEIELHLENVCCESFEKELVNKFDEFLDSNVLNLMDELRKKKED